MVRPIHHSPEMVKGLEERLMEGSLVGGAKGALFGAVTASALQLFSRKWRQKTTVPFRVFYIVSCISCGIVYACDKGLIAYEQEIMASETLRRKEFFDKAAERGEIYSSDGRRVE